MISFLDAETGFDRLKSLAIFIGTDRRKTYSGSQVSEVRSWALALLIVLL
ncbi:hypothetical protein QUA56_26360 [Microcoleus sp. N3A4]